MKMLLQSVFLLSGATLIWNGNLAAQEGPDTAMIEIISCNFTDGNGMDEFMEAADSWNDWADEHNVSDYSALIMTPFIHSDEMTADVLWYGTWPSGNAMGVGLGQWLREGGDVLAEFEAVVDCPSTSLFAETVLREYTGELPELGVAMMQNCTLREGRSIAEALAAGRRWGEYVAANGPVSVQAQLYAFGGQRPSSPYLFKFVQGFESPEGYGEFMHMLTSNNFAGAQASQGILGPYVDCDSPRAYAVNFLRVSSGG